MIFLKYNLNKLRHDSVPNADFKLALRARLVDRNTVTYRVPSSFMRYSFATAALALIMFLSVSSYAYASSGVTEGDLLYPVKTGIETVEGSFKHTPEAQARFRARMLDRRFREIGYRLRHHQPLLPRDVAMLARYMNMSVDELKALKYDEAGRELAKTELKLKLTNSLTTFRTRIELSDLTEAQKDRYLQAIDLRLKWVNAIPTTAP